MTGVVGRASVFVAPVGTPPDAVGAWTRVGYAEGVAFEAESAVPPHLFRQLTPMSKECRRTAEAIEGSR